MEIDQMEIDQIIELFQNLAPTGLGSVITILIGLSARELSKLRESVQELNIQIAVVVQKVESHEDRLNALESKPSKAKKLNRSLERGH